MPQARVATPFSADVEPPLIVILLGMMADATDECSASESLSVQVTSSKDRVDRDMLYKGGIGAPCKSEDDQSLHPRRSLWIAGHVESIHSSHCGLCH